MHKANDNISLSNATVKRIIVEMAYGVKEVMIAVLK